MPNPAPILSNPAILSALAAHWHNQNEEPPLMHSATGRYLSPDQFMSFLLAARDYPFRSCAALLTSSLLTGIPPDNLRQVFWSDVDTEGGTLIAFSDMFKRFDCHTLTKPARLFLDRWAQNSFSDSGLVFELYGDLIEMDALTETLRDLGRLAGIAELAFDDLVLSYDYIALVEALCGTSTPAQPASTTDASTPCTLNEGD